MTKELKVVIDTREQEPWEFPGIRSVRRSLKFGDYTLAGLEHKAVIERKSAADLAHTMTKDFHRGCREILGAKEEGIELFIIVEATMDRARDEMQRYSPTRVFERTLARFATVAGVSPIFTGGRKSAARLAVALLETFR